MRADDVGADVTWRARLARRATPRLLLFAACREICEVSQGTIKKLMDKGFGFIKGENGELFFHHSSVTNSDFDSLREGQEVEYTEGVGPKGPRAENVTVIQP